MIARSAAPIDRSRVHYPAAARVGARKRRNGVSVRHDDAVRRVYRGSQRR